MAALALLGARGVSAANAEGLVAPPGPPTTAQAQRLPPTAEVIEAPPLALPPADQPLLVPPGELELEEALDGPIVCLDDPLPTAGGSAVDIPEPRALHLYGYNPASSRVAWLSGDDDQFGIVTLENLATLGWEASSGVVAGFGVHFLDGPLQTEMPARLYDFTIGYQRREWIRPNFGWDFVFRVGAFSDFEGSAKDGVRFPSHVVTMLRLSPTLTWLLGIDYLDRDDINLLPVFGAVWTPIDYLRLDLAFPRPRAAMRIMDSGSWIYAAGELGGGTWAIEREQSQDDNATYRDLRLIFGIETLYADHASSALELGYVFARDLEFRTGVGDYSPDDCLMIALVSRY